MLRAREGSSSGSLQHGWWLAGHDISPGLLRDLYVKTKYKKSSYQDQIQVLFDNSRQGFRDFCDLVFFHSPAINSAR